MKTVFSYLLCSAFLLPSLNVQAQVLLPKPRLQEMRKGTFRTDCPFRIENQVGEEVQNPYDSFLTAATAHDGSLKRVVRYLRAESVPSPEAYMLNVSADTIEIKASDRMGFLRAAQTLRQLHTAKGVACCYIQDEPAYPWRGVMLDVSRHFFPIDFIKKQVDVLAAYKINRLHLHLTDAAGWRMEIKRYPRLTSIAAWRTDSLWKTWWNNGKRHYATSGTPGAYGGYYTQSELRDLVTYAANRGITVVPEIEMPAHSEEVLTAYPELSCTHEPYKQADFCPGSVATYDFLEHVLEEVMDVFPSTYIHVGGDEAAKASWPSCPLCQAKMKELGINKVDGLQAHLITHMGKFLAKHGRQLVGWDEVIAGDLADNTTVMVWRGTEKAREAIEHGYDVVLSPGSYCYLDSYQDAPPTQPEAIGGYLTLEKVYNYVPGDDLPENFRKQVKGVQGNLWTEYVPTEAQAEYMLYPRTLALAEIGWNGTAKKDYAEFRQRAVWQTEWLRKQKNVHAFDLKKEVGERIAKMKPLKHKALGAKVIYAIPASEAYRAAGDATLTDGLRGGWANNDGRWQGFISGNRLDVTIDLGKVQKVSSVSNDFIQVCGPEIYYPSQYIVSLSVDGQNFEEVYNYREKSEKTINPNVRTYRWKGRAKQARYVRVQALPSDYGGWVFTDEVVVE